MGRHASRPCRGVAGLPASIGDAGKHRGLVYSAAMLRPFVFVLMIASAWSAAMAEQPRSGIDVSAIDRSVPPQQDFWQFANGKWLAATPGPADRSAWDTFSEVREKTQGQLRSAIESIDPNEQNPERRKLADLY